MRCLPGTNHDFPVGQLFLESAALGGDVSGYYQLAMFYLIFDSAFLNSWSDDIRREFPGRQEVITESPSVS